MKFRATPREKERIEKLAKALGISMSKLILVAVLEAPPASVTRLDPETERQFAKIGNNINQIARVCNYRAKAGQSIDVLRLNLLLKQILEEVKAICSSR